MVFTTLRIPNKLPTMETKSNQLPSMLLVRTGRTNQVAFATGLLPSEAGWVHTNSERRMEIFL